MMENKTGFHMVPLLEGDCTLDDNIMKPNTRLYLIPVESTSQFEHWRIWSTKKRLYMNSNTSNEVKTEIKSELKVNDQLLEKKSDYPSLRV